MRINHEATGASNIVRSAMKLTDSVLEEIARMVVGDAAHFPYRSSYYITRFFKRCGLPFTHDGTTRPKWTNERLQELNLGPATSVDLPPDDLCRVISELFEQDDFDRHNRQLEQRGEKNPEYFADIAKALESFNKIVKRHSITAYLDESGRCFLRTTGTGISSASYSQTSRPLSQEEIGQRKKLTNFLDGASEDEFIEKILVPLFQRLGYRRVTPTGHSDRSLEFGKDLWMKYQLPTGHWIYFCAQVKKNRIDSNNASSEKNVANILTQARMAIDHPILDTEINRMVLLDHLYLISAGDITKAARSWLAQQLDVSQRRYIIFMDREEFLDQSARILLDLELESTEATEVADDDIPF